MSESKRTHYEVLGVRPSATLEEIVIAYQKILQHNMRAANIGPFNHQRAQAVIQDAFVAMAVLSNSRERSAYNEKMGVEPEEYMGKAGNGAPNETPQKSFNPFTKYTEYSAFFNQPSGDSREKANIHSDAPDGEEGTAKWSDEAPPCVEAVSRYMTTDTGTVVDIIISGWRLKLNLSSKFKFLNDVSELSDPHDNESVSFQIGLAYNTNSAETTEATINELTVKIESLPDDIGGEDGSAWGIARMQTLFKESISDMSTLTLSIAAASFAAGHQMPWEFGFDFDLNMGVQSHRRGTCLIFSPKKYPEYFKDYVGADSPEFELRKDKDVNANVFRNIASEKVMKMDYGNVEMWRLAAVGWRG